MARNYLYRREALEMDKGYFYVADGDETAEDELKDYFYVYGSPSGFCYGYFPTAPEAEALRKELEDTYKREHP